MGSDAGLNVLELGTDHVCLALLAPLPPGWLGGCGRDCHGQVPLLTCTALVVQRYGSKSPGRATLSLGWPHQGQGEAWLLYHGILCWWFFSVMGVVAFERPDVNASSILQPCEHVFQFWQHGMEYKIFAACYNNAKYIYVRTEYMWS